MRGDRKTDTDDVPRPIRQPNQHGMMRCGRRASERESSQAAAVICMLSLSLAVGSTRLHLGWLAGGALLDEHQQAHTHGNMVYACKQSNPSSERPTTTRRRVNQLAALTHMSCFDSNAIMAWPAPTFTVGKKAKQTNKSVVVCVSVDRKTMRKVIFRRADCAHVRETERTRDRMGGGPMCMINQQQEGVVKRVGDAYASQ